MGVILGGVSGACGYPEFIKSYHRVIWFHSAQASLIVFYILNSKRTVNNLEHFTIECTFSCSIGDLVQGYYESVSRVGTENGRALSLSLRHHMYKDLRIRSGPAVARRVTAYILRSWCRATVSLEASAYFNARAGSMAKSALKPERATVEGRGRSVLCFGKHRICEGYQRPSTRQWL